MTETPSREALAIARRWMGADTAQSAYCAKEIDAFAAQRAESYWRHKLAAFVTEILHGDEKHKRWLRDAAHTFAAGEDVPKPNATPPDADALEWAREALEDPPEAVIARGVAMLNTPRGGSDETLIHDIWQAMVDELRSLAEER